MCTKKPNFWLKPINFYSNRQLTNLNDGDVVGELWFILVVALVVGNPAGLVDGASVEEVRADGDLELLDALLLHHVVDAVGRGEHVLVADQRASAILGAVPKGHLVGELVALCLTTTQNVRGHVDFAPDCNAR